MRHGEAEDNINELLSSSPLRCSVLTKKGRRQVVDSANTLGKIDKVYTSPLIRTLQTAKIITENQGNKISVIIDDRIREINWGRYDGQANNQDLDEVRTKQANGDYFVRFGDYGENKFDVESRLVDFLSDISKDNFSNNSILIIAHGTVISFMKRILQLSSSHAKKGKFEIFNDVDFKKINKTKSTLRQIQKQSITSRNQTIGKLPKNLHKEYSKIAKDFNNIEFTDEILNKLCHGIAETEITEISRQIDKSTDQIILICVFRNFSNFIDQWFEHYAKIGIKNFVLINNNSDDDSIAKIKTYTKKLNIDLLSISEKFECYKSCGWIQQIMEKYGTNRWYLIVDSDELFVYKNRLRDIDSFIKWLENKKKTAVKSLTIDLYSNKPFNKQLDFNDFIYADKTGYKTENRIYGQRYYGGMRERIFNIRPSLQKIPLIYYTGKELIVNNHFYFPYDINKKSSLLGYLKHYKFCSLDFNHYMNLASENVHWNNSSEYKTYLSVLKNNPMFYHELISTDFNNIDISLSQSKPPTTSRRR